MAIQLREHQNKALRLADESWAAGKTNVCLVLPTGAGKCHGVDTPILMFDGTVKMVQDVKVGDQLMGADSTSRDVLALANGSEMLYRVTPTKGDSYVVNESHILSLKQTGLKSNPKYKCQEGKGDIKNISIKDYLASSKNFKHTHKGWRTGVDFETKDLPELLPPYLLGLWLGDGTTNDTAITSADVEIVDYVTNYANDNGFSLRVVDHPDNASNTYYITNGSKRNSGLKHTMRNYGLIGDKHIPIDYKTGDEQQRLELLAGLLDSDGHYDGKSYDVVFKVEQLANDLAYLARSLGLAAYVKPCVKKCYNTEVTGDYHRISISGDFTRIPTRLKRNVFVPRKQKKSVLVTGIKVEPIGVGEYFGFNISGDHLYLLGDFTVTHNTLIMAEFARREQYTPGITVLFAHRDVLLGQISDALCLLGVRHAFLASKPTVNNICNSNLEKHGDSFRDDTAKVIVISVDTYLARTKKGQTEALSALVTLWMMDETHHMLVDNKWGTCVENFVNARGIGMTATPWRGDKKGLGKHHDGVFEDMHVVVTMGELIELGYLSPYRILVPPTLLDASDMKVTASGDYNQKELAKRTDKSNITGDVVKHYLSIAPGQQAITFTVNIEHSNHVAAEFNKAGVTSVALSSQTPTAIRNKAVDDFKAGRIKNLVNCDLFGEGFDVPAVVVCIMLRKTQSLSLFKQQFGRALRVLDGKTHGILIDHVGNVGNHCVYGDAPHDDPEWSLDRRSKNKSNDDGSTMRGRVCPNCFTYYVPQGNVMECPDPACRHVETQAEKVAAQQDFIANEGVLVELDIQFVTNLLKEREKVDQDSNIILSKMRNAPSVVRNSAVNNHIKRQHAQAELRQVIQAWCAKCWSVNGWDLLTTQLEFERVFKVNIFKAQTLSERLSHELTEKIRNEHS